MCAATKGHAGQRRESHALHLWTGLRCCFTCGVLQIETNHAVANKALWTRVTCYCGMWVSQGWESPLKSKWPDLSCIKDRGKRPIDTVGLWIIAWTPSFTKQLSWGFTKLDGRFSKQWTGPDLWEMFNLRRPKDKVTQLSRLLFPDNRS